MEEKVMFDFWKFLAGLGIFLIGLQFMERGLRNLAGRSFKKLLRKHTVNPVRGVVTGTGVTALLQSSTLVSLMMIAFVGAGILTLNNAIGVIFGANLGTTITGWIVAWLGFDLDIAKIAMPLVAVGALAIVFFNKKEHITETGYLILGFGFLFVGLSFMKEPVESLAENIDPETYNGFQPYLMYPLGVLLAALLNSGSAVMAMALSFVSAGLIPMESAAVLVIGSDLGKTAPVIIGSIRGLPVQKQLAASHFLFNLITNLAALLSVYPVLWFISHVIGIQNPLYTLTAFHSLINLAGILLILPFTSQLAKLVSDRFAASGSVTRFISSVPVTIPETAIEALHKEILHLADKVAALNIEGMRIADEPFDADARGHTDFEPGTYTDHYAEVKQLQGETIRYFMLIQNEKLTNSDSELLNRHSHALRHLLKSAKRLKNVTHNVKEFETSGNDAKHALMLSLKEHVTALYMRLHEILHTSGKTSFFNDIRSLIQQNKCDYNRVLDVSYGHAREGALSDLEIATFQNASHEIYSANKSLLEAMAYVLLTPSEEEELSKMPELN